MNNSPEITEAPKTTLVEKPEAQFELTEGMDAQAVVKKLDETHAPAKYREAIKAYTEKIMGDRNEKMRSALVSESSDNYGKLYRQAVDAFYASTEALKDRHEDLLDNITDQTKSSLAVLKGALEGEKTISETAPETFENMADYVDALADRYLNTERAAAQFEVQFGAENADKLTDEYEDKANAFREGLQDQVAAHIAWMKETERDTPDNLKSLKESIEKRFQDYAGGDQLIDLKDLITLETRAKAYVDLIKQIQTSKNVDKTLTDTLKAKELLEPKDWERAVHDLTAMVIKSAVEYGAEQKLIDYAQTKSGQTEMNFRQAADWVQDYADSLAKEFPTKSIQQTVDALRDINNTIHGDRLAYFNNVKESIRNLVYLEREDFLSGRNPLERTSNKSVVEFMRQNRKGRDEILADPNRRAALFAGIQDIITNYPQLARPGNIPNKREELTTARKQGGSTEHDKIAQTMALISFAKEAQWLVNQTEFADELGATKAVRYQAGEIKMDYRTKQKRRTGGYVSMASRGGFNGTELGLTALKVASGFVVLANVLNARDKTKGPIGAFFNEDFVKGVVENPAVWAGVGTIYGVNKYRENKEVGDILFKDPYGRERLGVHLSINGIDKRLQKENISRAALLGFMANGAEFDAMQKLNPKKVESLLKRAAKKQERLKLKEPVLSKEDLTEVIGPELAAKLGGDQNDRVRYLFYEKFLNQKRHIGDLRDHCSKWKPESNQA